MPKMHQVLLCTAMWLVAGCAHSPPIQVAEPSPETLNSTQGDYRAFVQSWMGNQPARPAAAPYLGMPAESRIIEVRDEAAGLEQLRALHRAFFQWCASSGGKVRLLEAAEDVKSKVRACETAPKDGSPEAIALVRIFLNSGPQQPAKQALLVEHWYRPDVDRYFRETQLIAAEELRRKNAAEVRLAQDQERIKQEAAIAAAAQREKDRAGLEEYAASARTKTTQQCLQFERQSNALRARLMGALQRPTLQQYLSDLIVAFDECVNARPTPPGPLLSVYRFNLETFHMYSDAWAIRATACAAGPVCRDGDVAFTQQELVEIARLQARRGPMKLSPPQRFAEILERVQRFSLER